MALGFRVEASGLVTCERVRNLASPCVLRENERRFEGAD